MASSRAVRPRSPASPPRSSASAAAIDAASGSGPHVCASRWAAPRLADRGDDVSFSAQHPISGVGALAAVEDKPGLKCGRAEHARWRVVKDGFVGAAPRRRQRYRCLNPDGPAGFHRWLPPVPRLEALHDACLECENALSSGQGPKAPRQYAFAAKEVATALTALAHGKTYQEASQQARLVVAGQLAHAVVECTGTGVCTSDYNALAFRKVRRPMYPLDAM